MVGQRTVATLALFAALAAAGRAAAQTQDLATAVANVTRFCLARADPSKMGLSPAALQAFCRCEGMEMGRRIPLADLTGPATPKYDAVARVTGRVCYEAAHAAQKR